MKWLSSQLSNSNGNQSSEVLTIATKENELRQKKKTGSGVVTRNRRKRGKRELTTAQELLAAAIEKWHEYEEASLSCGKCDPISYTKLLELSGVRSKDTAKTFFDDWLKRGNTEYKELCNGGKPKALAIAIAKLSRTGAMHVVSYAAELLEDSKALRQEDD